MVEKVVKKQPEGFIDFIQELITTKSWWDTVDWISKFVGIYFQRFPHLVKPVTERWMASGNIWLQRVCLIFQLSLKDKTDFALMCDYILRLADSKEFFIQKGAGWALRQYSKLNPVAVTGFIETHPQLAPLTKREGLKWLKNQGKI
jgi:3-methyladenine DNA glycosylase AlkD